MRACLHLCQHPLSAPLHPKTVLYSADSFMGNQRQAGCPGRAGPGVAQSGGVPHQGTSTAADEVGWGGPSVPIFLHPYGVGWLPTRQRVG